MRTDEPSECPIHGVPLELDEVRIVYGLLRTESGYLEAQRTQFPFARQFVTGGCVDDPNVTHETVRYCPQCRKAFEDWNESRKPRS